MAHQFSDSTFETEVLQNNTVTVVDFWAEWCGPCLTIGPVVEALSTEYEGRAVIGKMNVDHNSEIPTKYGIRGIPTLLIFKNGELKDRIVGVAPNFKQTLSSKIDALLS
jgi:thioredoxin 1